VFYICFITNKSRDLDFFFRKQYYHNSEKVYYIYNVVVITSTVDFTTFTVKIYYIYGYQVSVLLQLREFITFTGLTNVEMWTCCSFQVAVRYNHSIHCGASTYGGFRKYDLYLYIIYHVNIYTLWKYHHDKISTVIGILKMVFQYVAARISHIWHNGFARFEKRADRAVNGEYFIHVYLKINSQIKLCALSILKR